MTTPQKVAPTTKSGISMPEGSLSPANYVGDPSGGKFIDWGSTFLEKGLPPPAEANEHGTPSMYMGKATGFGKLAGGATAPLSPPEPMSAKYDDREPDGSGTGTGNPYQSGITGDNPYAGSGAAHVTESRGGPAQPAPAGVPPAKMSHAIPFAGQLAPLFAAMAQAPKGPTKEAPPLELSPEEKKQEREQNRPPPPMAATMDNWIDWSSHVHALMGVGVEEQEGRSPQKPQTPPRPPQRASQAPQQTAPAPAAPPVKKPKPPPSSATGRGSGGASFTYGKDDVASQAPAAKSMDVDGLLALLEPLAKSKYVSKAPRVGGGYKAQEHRRQTDDHPSVLGKSEKMNSARDIYGRSMRKGGLYNFTHGSGSGELPETYLYDYLCAFVEEAYESESREVAHSKLDAKEQLPQMARAIMNELVQAIPQNKNLARAAKKYTVSSATIAHLLVAKGIYKPRADSQFTDDGNAAMGAHLLAQSDFAFSHSPTPFLSPIPAPVTARAIRHHVDDASNEVLKGDVVTDPHVHHAVHQQARMRSLWKGAAPTIAQASPDCPVHGGREIHKSMNLWNPMLPCTCGGRPNAHG